MELTEKGLPTYHDPRDGEISRKQWKIPLTIVGIISALLYFSNIGHVLSLLKPPSPNDPHNPDSLCPIVDKVDPLKYLYNNDTLLKILHDDSFKNESLKKLADSIKISTEVYDDMINPNSAETYEKLYELEPKWKKFEEFHTFLKKTFPEVHQNLKVETINKFSLVYTWKGSSDKKPIMLAAHMDVVPVDPKTMNQWTYPPFDGIDDGEFLYGRGVSDCKNLLIGLLETAELLLSEGKFSPERTIILAFGYDEESSGSGAYEIYKHIEKRYGHDSLYAIIDEGTQGYETIEGRKFILPATGEKGYLDSVIDLFTPGGHSSVPPQHTLIGILAKLISEIEDEQFKSIITNANPVLNQLQCIAEHSSTVDRTLRKNILKSHFDVDANKEVLKYLSKYPETKFLVTTSQAVDMVQGGTKSNALPEYASVLVNHRIAVEESVEMVTDKVLGQVKNVAERFDLGIVFNGEEIRKRTPNGYFNYSLVGLLEPAPITPINDKIWNTFGGSLRYLYEELVSLEASETFIVSPFISTGNTDTKSYWDLTRNIFRYTPGISTSDNIHSIDEKLLIDSHFQLIAFYYYYLQVVDKLDDELL
ncbi:uncharacterized protein AC631_00680 [Debaryomyces fabryi]|uniref:Peptidase M20 dimerisation domain-containing protein n=1 Tax=Debaryomyces fabryi TaxID=58627 RepID=A0A0V1Q5J1_9ASCO|nr:uncharacterized protein AC631_00680 [Debaryomyces fabryi]KSA03541.1 hypothetical protein AC631_00680 [Debaryomyces fabryi]